MTQFLTSVAVFEAAITDKVNVYNKIVIENKKTMKIKDFFYINLHLKDGIGMKFTAFRGDRAMAVGALTSYVTRIAT